MVDSSASEAPRRALVFALPATPGMWLGLAGTALSVAAATFPWYTISARVPPQYPDFTVLIQLDGVRGLYVAPELATQVKFSAPSIGLPFLLIFLGLAALKVFRLARAPTHKKRASSLQAGAISILFPFLFALVALSLIPSFIPADQTEARAIGEDVASHPLGGSTHFSYNTGSPVPGSEQVDGDVEWGFGPALPMMVAASVLMFAGSMLERGAERKAAPAEQAPP